MFRVAVPPDSYKVLEAQYSEFCSRMEEPLVNIQMLLQKTLAGYGLNPTIRSRLKKFPSVYEKLLTKLREAGSAVPGEILLTDVLGLRVICPFMEDTEKVIYILKREFEITEEERKGSAEFGYSSTHLLMSLPDNIRKKHNIDNKIDGICEIQVRTILQDAWAEVEHEIIYKSESSPLGEPLKRKLAALNASLTLSDITFQEIRDYQRGLKNDLAQRRQDFQESIKKTNGADSGGDSLDPIKYTDKVLEEKPPLDAGRDLEGLSESVDQLLILALKEHNASRFDRAEEIYTKILSKVENPKTRTVILMHRGMAAFSQMAYTRALEDFTQAGEEDPQNAKARYYRGIVYRVLGRSEDALEDFTQSIALDPYQTDPLLARAQLHFQLGGLAETLKDCRAALALNSSLEDALKLHNMVMARIYRNAAGTPEIRRYPLSL